MADHDRLAERFETHRSHLRGVAYRMLGSLSEADDAVQEAWLRLSRSDTADVENLAGWLTRVVARVGLDMLRTRRSRREEPLNPQQPGPIVNGQEEGNPEQEALLADSVGLALLVVLDRLAPAERVAFVLHDLFAMPFDEIAPIVERTPTAAKKLASRARRRIQGTAPSPGTDLARQRQVVGAFSGCRARRARQSSAAPKPWRRRPACSRGRRDSRDRRSLTARWESSWPPVESCASPSVSRS